jgi:outer membrane protein OmpA-like peptidoglycan-associated protein
MKKAFTCLLLFIAFLSAPGQTFQITDNSFVLNSYHRTNRILFGLGSENILPESHSFLDSAVLMLKKHPGLSISVIAHTELRGNSEANLILSSKRAQAVMDYFIEKGITQGRIKAVGKGETEPLYTAKEISEQPKCEPDQGKPYKRNNRTEFIITAL